MTDTLRLDPADGTATDALLSIVYTSTAVEPFSEVDLALLLSVSRMHNEASRLSGLLLHRAGRFMQALEGPEREVRAAFRTISADPRHTDVRVLEAERIGRREFGSWAMGYRTPAAPNGSPWFGSPDALDQHEGAGRLLARFRAT